MGLGAWPHSMRKPSDSPSWKPSGHLTFGSFWQLRYPDTVGSIPGHWGWDSISNPSPLPGGQLAGTGSFIPPTTQLVSLATAPIGRVPGTFQTSPRNETTCLSPSEHLANSKGLGSVVPETNTKPGRAVQENQEPRPWSVPPCHYYMAGYFPDSPHGFLIPNHAVAPPSPKGTRGAW